MSDEQTTDLTDFIEFADRTMIEVIALSRDEGTEQQEGHIAMIVTDGPSFDGIVLAATGTVAHDRDFASIAVRGFHNSNKAKLDVMDLGDEIIITLKNT